MILTYTKLQNDCFKTINDVLNNFFCFSTTLRNKLIKDKQVLTNGSFKNTNLPINENDTISIFLGNPEDNSNIQATKMQLNILFEDDWVLVLDKPAHIAIHPSFSYFDNTLSNGVKYYFDSIGLKKKIRPVNRLDVDTSGIVVFAKCAYVQERLISQMSTNIFKKEYFCFCNNTFEYLSTLKTISKPIGRKDGSIIERCISENGAPSITKYTVLKNFDTYSLIKCFLETGRTHQIRVHFASISHPLLGDTLYGSSSKLVTRQALHSFHISFIHPATNTSLQIYSPLPDDLIHLDIK